MSYTGIVEPVPCPDDRRILRYAVGAMLCGLLLVYALGAKLALYHVTQPGARSVAATKAWEDHAPSVESQIAPVLAVPAIINFTLLVGLVFMVVWPVVEDESPRKSVLGFSPHLAVRPPPSI